MIGATPDGLPGPVWRWMRETTTVPRAVSLADAQRSYARRDLVERRDQAARVVGHKGLPRV